MKQFTFLFEKSKLILHRLHIFRKLLLRQCQLQPM